MSSQAVTGIEVCSPNCKHSVTKSASVPACHKSSSVPHVEKVPNAGCETMGSCYLEGETEQNPLVLAKNVEIHKPGKSFLNATRVDMKDCFPSNEDIAFSGAIRDGPPLGVESRPVYLFKNSFII